MVTIALCDDDPNQLYEATRVLNEYQAARPGVPLRKTIFSSALELLEYVESQGCFDLYLLDVIMPGQNGIDLGLELRRHDEQGVIIYLTTSPEYAVDSYLARAYHYLLKPVDKEQLFSTLDEAVGQILQAQNAAITFKTKEGLQRLTVHSIRYGDLDGRRIRLHLSSGSTVNGVSLRESFQEAMAPLLKHRQFILCTASCIVNLAFVEKIERDRLWLRDGAWLPLSRSRRDKVTDRWMDFCLNGGTPGGL